MVVDDDARPAPGSSSRPADGAERPARDVVSAVSLACWLALIAVTVVWGRHLLDRGVRLAIGAAPLSGRFGWRVSADALVPVTVGVAVVIVVPWIAARMAWVRLLVLGGVLSVAWAAALSRVDGSRALFSPFYSPAYLQTAQTIHNPQVFLSQFVQRIHSYNSHARGHPPGMELLLWATARVGLAGVGWNTVLAMAGGAVAGAAALITLREIADEHRARIAMPFVVLAPARDLVVIWRRVLRGGVGLCGGRRGARDRRRRAQVRPNGAARRSLVRRDGVSLLWIGSPCSRSARCCGLETSVPSARDRRVRRRSGIRCVPRRGFLVARRSRCNAHAILARCGAWPAV